ncbi:PEP-CTERM sorting domain-containing protein [Pontiella sp. NLcol2]|uniref:PEP-CTERM sorting domain-containing protein n=2 Tax=Pontiella agarivorans TaxID=3038953 RepID=A0ABU5N0Q4_9BACT|nr:PEP-CTERM sorting domain-containing protein [Pontiella agarivorans]
MKIIHSVLASMLTTAVGVHAALIIPTGSTASSESGGRGVGNLYNGVELVNTGDVNDWTQYSMNPADDNLSKGEGWMANNNSGAWIILDLGAVYALDTISIWNFNSSTNQYIGRSVSSMNVYVRSTADTLNVAGSKAAFDSTGWASLQAAAAVSVNPQDTTITAPNAVFDSLTQTGRYLAFEVDSTSGSDGGSTKYAGMGEVQVFGAVVPEPAALGLIMVAGGSFLFIRRRFMM